MSETVVIGNRVVYVDITKSPNCSNHHQHRYFPGPDEHIAVSVPYKGVNYRFVNGDVVGLSLGATSIDLTQGAYSYLYQDMQSTRARNELREMLVAAEERKAPGSIQDALRSSLGLPSRQVTYAERRLALEELAA